MELQDKLNKVTELNQELTLIKNKIEYLSGLANKLMNNEFTQVEMIIETMPKNGAMPYIVPLYDKNEAGMFDYLSQGIPMHTPHGRQVGYQRYYKPNELVNEDILSISVMLDIPITLAVIDKVIIRLKQKREVILRETKQILKAG